VDIVHIGTPPYLHGPMARQAAERGKHVFVEKPFATTLTDAHAAVDAARLAGVQLSIDYVLRHHPIHRMTIALSRSNALGRLQHFALENFASAANLPPEHWFWDPGQSGGIHVEHGVHFLDLAIALAGREPDVVSGTSQVRSDGRIDRVGALSRFGDAMTATFYHSFTPAEATERTTIRLAFERGHATIDGWIPTVLRFEGTVEADSLPTLTTLVGEPLSAVDAGVAAGTRNVLVSATVERLDRQNEYRLAIRSGMKELVAAIRDGAPLTVTPEDGVRSLRMAIMATEDRVVASR
jgi:predicted dehydrogenase